MASPSNHEVGTMRRAIVPDAHLFEASLRDVKPLKRRKAPRKIEAPPPVAPVAHVERAAPVVRPAPKPAEKPQAPQLDGSTTRKLARGLLPIDATLDLHGLTQAQAHAALDRFVGRQIATPARVLLIVTGKGKGGEGALKRLMPEWLMAGPHASRILKIASAARLHGGGGAFYVMLRRKR
jgi:DNA-nicking Smr family endonuclease